MLLLILKRYNVIFLIELLFFVFILSISTKALSLSDYKKYVDEGWLGSNAHHDMRFNAKGQMYRKFGHFIIDGSYKGGDAENPFYNEENTRDLAILAGDGDSIYDVYAEVEDDEIDYSYEDDETLTATDYNRAAFQAKLDAMNYGNTLHNAVGYGKYNLRAGKNLTAFIKFAYDFYVNQSGEERVGLKNDDMLKGTAYTSNGVCPMEDLETYAKKVYTDTNGATDGAFKDVWIKCSTKWNYVGDAMSDYSENIFETLQDIFMGLVYLKPAMKVISKHLSGIYDSSSKNYLEEEDYAAILSMMYERFGGRPINPSKVDTSEAIPVVGTGDILGALINFPELSMADRIYAYMIEIKYKNNDIKLASWLKEYEDVMGSEYTILDADKYDRFMKAYQIAYKEYGQDTANDTLLDYGCVLTPDIFESKISYEKALRDFANTIKSHFGGSSFYNNRNNANFVAKSYAMAKKMCENSAFSDITDIYACDMDVIEHSFGYESPCILLADTQVVELQDVLTIGSDTDSDGDTLPDYVEAGVAEEVDITDFIIEYCKYNKYTETETADMLAKNSKVTMYNYKSNPVLPDSDFDGRDDKRDSNKLDNKYKAKVDTDNYSGLKIDFCQDYRYFFMDKYGYYEDLAEMSLMLSNMASKNKNGQIKTWTNTNSGENYKANSLRDYMWYIGMDDIDEHLNEEVPYALAHHDALALMGKVNNLERNIVTCVIGEDENYKNKLASNYDGSLGVDGSYEGDHHHIGYDIEANKIYEKLMNYEGNLGDRWKKSYWIVGYGTGGAIANLVAKKLIDSNGNRQDVYCYTYQAPNTINRNNLTKRIYNAKYQSIFNIINEDDYIMVLENEKMNMTKYGVIKKYSLGDSSSAISRWNKNKGILKTYTGSYKKAKKVISDIVNYDRDVEVVVGFGLSEMVMSIKNVLQVIRYYCTKAEYIVDDSYIEDMTYEEQTVGKNIQTKNSVEYKQTSDQASGNAGYDAEKATEKQDLITLVDVENNEGNQRFVKTVEDTAIWYINHVATYYDSANPSNHNMQKSGETIRATNLAKSYYETNFQKNTKSDDGYKKPLMITNFGKVGYYYEPFKDFDTTEAMVGNKDYNYYAQYVGDDCTGFLQAVMYTLKGGSKEDEKRGKGNGSNGLYNHNESASKLISDDNTEQAMYNLGYEKILVTKDTRISDLRTGDILVCNDHAEIYVGDNYNFVLEKLIGNNTQRNISKKELVWDESLVTKIDGVTLNPFDTKAVGTFGWGGVNDEFPVESKGGIRHYFYKSPDEECIRHCQCGRDPTDKTHKDAKCKFDDRKYTVIWRKQ